MLEAYEHIALQYTNQWEPLNCQRNENNKNRSACLWFIKTYGQKLQIPKYRVGDHVKFHWSQGILAGNVQCVFTSYEPRDNRKTYFKVGIFYAVYADGDERWVDERLIIGVETK